MCSYLKDRQKAVQVNNNFSLCKKFQAGVPQRSIGGPLLFYLFIYNLFLIDILDALWIAFKKKSQLHVKSQIKVGKLNYSI